MINKPKDETPMQKISFRIIEVSSEEEGYPVTELLNHTPFSRGWQSSRFCDYPQEILLEFPKTVRVKQIQFLSHQYKIATKIELLIHNQSSGPEGNKFKKFRKIGYLSLDSNERSNFQARELKSVYIDYQCQQMKFILHRCYTNVHNIYSQIGLIAINILGEYPDKAGDFTNKMQEEIKFSDKLEDEMIYDPITLKRLKNLHKAKEKAIELEDFDEAKKIKDAIERLKSVSQQLIQLEERKRIAIKNDDFDAAKLFKFEIERLRNAVAGINIDNIKVPNANHEINRKTKFNHDEYETQQDPYVKVQKGDKNVRLVPRNELEITNDYVMHEDDMNLPKTTNPGYNLVKDNEEKFNNKQEYPFPEEKPPQFDKKSSGINKVIDVDQQVIKGISRNFDEIVNEKLKEEGKNVKNTSNTTGEEDEIPASEYKKAEQLIPVLTYDVVKSLFSKYWKNKEDAVNLLCKEIQTHPHSKILSQHPEEKIITSIVGAAAYVLTSTVSQPLIATMEMLKVLFNKFRSSNIQGFTRQDFNSLIDQCMIYLIEKVGDANLKLKEKAENTVIEFANSSLIGHKIVFEHLITGQVKKTLVNSARHLSARLNLISRMIDNFGLDQHDVPVETLMNYTINAFKSPQKEVRDAALNLVLNVYKYIGDEIRKNFKDLRPAQVSMIEDAIDNLDGLNNYEKKEEVEQDDLHNDNNNEEFVNESKMINSAHIEEDVEEFTRCKFCGLFDPNFTEDDLVMHKFKECPMLIQCIKCKQIQEISSLNYHFLNECKFNSDFKQCGRCKEAIPVKDYNKHIAERSCVIAKNPSVANRCPLCHTDFTPSGPVGWEVHLVQSTCPNNPRTSY